MDDFLEKWKKDTKYRTKVKLLVSTLFVIFVSVYALTLPPAENTLDDLSDENKQLEDNTSINTDSNKSIIKVPNNYTYKINITIDESNYKYYGEKNINQTTITKETTDTIKNYIYENNEYYVKDNDLYVKTTKDEVYDIVNYNYINLESINTYLNKATNNNDQYLVYLKDIILGNNSEEYFVILVNNNKINIDYTPLMQEFNENIFKYTVDIEILEKE